MFKRHLLSGQYECVSMTLQVTSTNPGTFGTQLTPPFSMAEMVA
jgi:hypothetical protein